MSLEDHVFKHRQKRVIRRVIPEEAAQQLQEGRKFIVVDENFDQSTVPQGYTLIDMRFRGESFKTLVPQSLLFYMVNPGEGDIENALEEIADFYNEVGDFEDELVERSETSVQEVNWATLARENYRMYLVNKLVRNVDGKHDNEEEPVPEFNPDTLSSLDLDDDYVANRVRAMAAAALGKTADEVKGYGVGEVLKHITVRERGETETLTKEELEKVACYCGSHYELKPEFRSDPDYKYKVGSYSGTKTARSKQIPVFDAKIGELEKEIARYRAEKHSGPAGRHDSALIRQYANIAHIAKENPQAQLDIMPPTATTEREGEK